MGNYENTLKRPRNAINSKEKRVMNDDSLRLGQPCYYVLHVRIKRACNVDALDGVFRTIGCRYRLHMVESQSHREFKTAAVEGKPAPTWKEWLEIGFDERPDDECLFLEVVRLDCRDDPGTSSGNAVVGRAKIPIPWTLRDHGFRRYELIRLREGKKGIGGFIQLGLELKAIHLRHHLQWSHPFRVQ